MLERYSFEFQREVGPRTWVADLFLTLGAPYETLVASLEAIFYSDEVPFKGRNKRYITVDLLHVIRSWYADGARHGVAALFGGEDNALAVSQTLSVLQAQGELEPADREEARVLRERIEMLLR